MSDLAVQLYTLRDALSADPQQTLRRLADFGVGRVEAYGIQNSPWLAEALAEAGLVSPSAHGAVLTEAGEPNRATFEAAQAIGVETVILPSGPRDAFAVGGEVDAFAEKLIAASAVAKEYGLRVGYHNHDFEFVVDQDGRTGYDRLVQQLPGEIVLELDTYWAAFAGQDVPALLAILGDRVELLHIKDGPLVAGDNQVLGTGAMDLDPILDASGDKVWIVEFDSAAGDVFQAVEASVDYLRNR